MFKYEWDVTGEIPTRFLGMVGRGVRVQASGRETPGKAEEEEIPFTSTFKGDLQATSTSSNSASLSSSSPELIDADEGKYSISCPWKSEHTGQAQADDLDGHLADRTSGDGWPAFKCLHSHCDGKELKDVLAMGREPGKGNRRPALRARCASGRRGRPTPTASPRILHPQFDELDSVTHTKLGKIMGGRQAWFDWLGNACLLDNIRSGKVYVGEEEDDKSTHMPATVTGFKELEGLKARGHCEYFCIPGHLEKGRSAGISISSAKSFGPSTATPRSEDPHLLAELAEPAPDPDRSASPSSTPTGKRLIYPGPGYDPHFHTYMIKDAPDDRSRDAGRAREGDPGRDSRGVLFPQRRRARFTLSRELSLPSRADSWGSRREFRFGSSGRTDREPARTTSR